MPCRLMAAALEFCHSQIYLSAARIPPGLFFRESSTNTAPDFEVRTSKNEFHSKHRLHSSNLEIKSIPKVGFEGGTSYNQLFQDSVRTSGLRTSINFTPYLFKPHPQNHSKLVKFGPRRIQNGPKMEDKCGKIAFVCPRCLADASKNRLPREQRRFLIIFGCLLGPQNRPKITLLARNGSQRRYFNRFL